MGLEAKLQSRIIASLKKKGGWWKKISDKYQIGIPDIIGCYKGKFVAIEIKSPGGKPMLKQEYEMEEIRGHGQGIAFWVDNFEDFEEMFTKVTK